MRRLEMLEDTINRNSAVVTEDGIPVFTLKREDPKFALWTARDVDGFMVDMDMFSNDLLERLAMLPPTVKCARPIPGLKIIPDEALRAKFDVLLNMTHREHKYGDKPYSYHLDAVEAKVMASEHFSMLDRMIARGHDLLEMCSPIVTREEIALYYGEELKQGIDSLSRKLNQTYFDFIDEVCGCELNIIAIKLADVACNHEECLKNNNTSLAERYRKAQVKLLGAIAHQVKHEFNGPVTLSVDGMIDTAFKVHNEKKGNNHNELV